MTNRLSTKNLYFYYKLLCHTTQKQFYLYNESNRWMLFCNTEKGNKQLTRSLSLTEMYEVLYSMDRTMDALNGLYESPIKPLNAKDSKLLKENLHNDEFIHVVNE